MFLRIESLDPMIHPKPTQKDLLRIKELKFQPITNPIILLFGRKPSIKHPIQLNMLGNIIHTQPTSPKQIAPFFA